MTAGACRFVTIDRNRPLLIANVHWLTMFRRTPERVATVWCWGSEGHLPHWAQDPTPENRRDYEMSKRHWLGEERP